MSYKVIELCTESELPSDGWLQRCLECGDVTAMTLFVKRRVEARRTTDYRAYTCPRCRDLMLWRPIKYHVFVVQAQAQIPVDPNPPLLLAVSSSPSLRTT